MLAYYSFIDTIVTMQDVGQPADLRWSSVGHLATDGPPDVAGWGDGRWSPMKIVAHLSMMNVKTLAHPKYYRNFVMHRPQPL